MSDVNSNAMKVASKYPVWFNADQVKALDAMVEWSHDTKNMKYILEGHAGTGKTTIIKEFRKHCKARSGFIVAAPTHKAVRVIRESVGCEGYTVQKLLGLRPNFNIDNFDPNNVQYDPFGKRHIENYNTIVIDEASMLNQKMIQYIDKEAKTHNVKILYTGDPSQLPPVRESYSSVFSVPANMKSTLTQVMRQGDGNPLSPLLTDIRWAISKKKFDYINTFLNKSNLDNGKGYIHVSLETFQAYVLRAFNNEAFFNDINFCKLITYTNKNVYEWNQFIRAKIFPDAKEAVIIHDLFTCYNTIVDEFNEAKITNSEEYIVEQVKNYTHNTGLKGWMVKLKEVSTGSTTPYLFVVDHTDDENLKNYTFILQSKINAAKSRMNSPAQRSKKWGEYYAFTAEVLGLIDVYDPDDSRNLLNGKTLDYGYAITSHKAQGSTYKHAFVNLNNIIYGNGGEHMVNDANMINRLFYVAASRPQETLTILF